MATRAHHQLLMGGYPDFSLVDRGANIVISGAHKQLATNVVAGWQSVRGETARASGKYVFEFEFTAQMALNAVAVTDSGATLASYLGDLSVGSGITIFGSGTIGTSGAFSSSGYSLGHTPAAGDKLMFAIDFGTGKGWFKLSTDAGWAGGGDPAAGSNPAFTWTPSFVLFPGASLYGTTSPSTAITLNTGQDSFTNSVPSGFSPWGYQPFSIIDPLFSSVSSLLHFEGSNGGTVFTDQLGIVWTATGATTSTAQARFGASSGSFSGVVNSTQQYITSGSNIGLGGAGDLSVDCWLYATALPPVGFFSAIFDTRPLGSAAGPYITAEINSFGGVLLYANGVVQLNNSTGTLLVPNTWTLFSFTRSAGTCYVSLNGVAVGATWTDATVFTDNRMVIGGSASTLSGAGSQAWNGFIDEFRVSSLKRYQQKSGTNINYVPFNARFQNK
jgi:hypothetical protein